MKTNTYLFKKLRVRKLGVGKGFFNQFSKQFL